MTSINGKTKFGRLTIVGPAYLKDIIIQRKVKYWPCRCECGTTRLVPDKTLKSGDAQSCGCRQRQLAKERMTKHGRSKEPEYKSWWSMKSRCDSHFHPKYNDYGGRGISYCERWKSYPNFIKDVGKKPSPIHTIDRIDNNGNYEPSNVKWSTPTEQNRNRRPLKWKKKTGSLGPSNTA